MPADQQIYRCWIELRDRCDGSVRELPLQGLRKIHLPRRTGEPQLPDEVVLQLKDGAEDIEVRDIDDLAAQLRRKYPDEGFARREGQVPVAFGTSGNTCFRCDNSDSWALSAGRKVGG